MEPNSTMRRVPQSKAQKSPLKTLKVIDPQFAPYNGQKGFIDKLRQSGYPRTQTGQFPTGYGKTVVIAMTMRELYGAGLADRMLVIVANDQQAEQFRNDFPGDAKRAGLAGVQCWRVQNSPTDLVVLRSGVQLEGERNKREVNVFVATISTVSAAYRNKGGVNFFHEAMHTGKWLVACDEYHHYRDEADWGNVLKALCYGESDLNGGILHTGATHVIALSATPQNRLGKTIFSSETGKPDYVVTYRQAKKEGVLKNLFLCVAKYGVTIVDNDSGEVTDCTTCDLRSLVSTEDSSTGENRQKRRKLRISDKYVTDLIRLAAKSLMDKRAAIGNRVKLQMLIRTGSVAIAESTANMIRSVLPPDYVVEWVGEETNSILDAGIYGKTGRDYKTNKDILDRFIPPKDADGNRPEPSIDVLVQVGKCSEGSDTVFVSDVVDLSLSLFSDGGSKDRQFIGRGLRRIPQLTEEEQVGCTFWIPSDSDLLNRISELSGIDKEFMAKAIEKNIHGLSKQFQDWFDESIDDSGEDDFSQPPPGLGGDPPYIDIDFDKYEVRTVYRISVYSDDDERMEKWMGPACAILGINLDYAKSDKETMAKLTELYNEAGRLHHQKQDAALTLKRYKDELKTGCGRFVAFIRDRFYIRPGVKFDKSLTPDLYKAINKKMAEFLGGYRDNITSLDDLKNAIRFLHNESEAIRQTGKRPSWI